jgi:Protein of unknown function (DUF2892)
MRCEMTIRRFAGLFVLGSMALGYFVNPWWYLFTAFVGLNLLQSSFTNFCPLQMLFERLGILGCSVEPGLPRKA